jgi:glycosyltransferase involved in cell wall biosynthesis
MPVHIKSNRGHEQFPSRLFPPSSRDSEGLMHSRTRQRVAIVAASLDILGGQGVQAASLMARLQDDGYSACLIPINPPFPPGLRSVRAVRFLRTIVNEAIYLPSLARIASADVAHVFSGSYWSFLIATAPAMLAARVMRKRVVVHYHSGEAGDHLAHWGALVHPWLRLADEIVVPSTYLQEVFARHGYATRVIANVVDLSRFQYRERRPLRPRILSTRNLEPYYRVDLIVEAFARFRMDTPGASLTIAGYGSEERRLREMAVPLGDAVTFVGKVAPEVIPQLYADHDIFVNASVLDNQPVSILEAFASGLPVVSTTVGGIPEMSGHGEKAVLVKPLDATALAHGIRDVYRNPEQAIARAARARAAVASYTWTAVRDQWAAAYAEQAHADEITVAPEARALSETRGW